MANKRKNTVKARTIVSPPNTITYLNAASGLACIYFSWINNFIFAAGALLICVILDILDGKIASWLHKRSEFGKEVDSLADITSFGVAPAVFVYSLSTMFHSVSIFLITAIVLFVICGIIRLARYNVLNNSREFIGMPISINGLLFPLLYFISVPSALYPFILILSGVLMVSPFKIKRI